MKKWLKIFSHNVIIHPLMMLLSSELGTRLHDYNANWAFGLNRYPEQEPLSLEDLRVIINQLPTEVDLETGIELCRIVERAHGIGE